MPASAGGYRGPRLCGGYPGSGPCERMALGVPVVQVHRRRDARIPLSRAGPANRENRSCDMPTECRAAASPIMSERNVLKARGQRWPPTPGVAAYGEGVCR